MTVFILKRLAMMVATMFVASCLLFGLMEFSPGNVASKTLGPYATQAQKDILFERLSLDDPLHERYFRWLGVLMGVIPDPLQDPELGLNFKDPRGDQYFGNFGYSAKFKLPVNDVMWSKLGNTLILAGIAFAIIVPLSLLFGVLSGMREGSTLDRGLSYTGIALTSVPEFASAVFLMAIFVLLLGWLPGTASMQSFDEWSWASQMVLPVAVLVLYDFGYVARMVRGSMVEVMTKPYIRTAMLKGLPYKTVILRHALRNALIAPFTVILLQIPFLITGVVVTEQIFGYPGFGRMLLEAALFGDIALVEAATLVAVFIAVSTQLIGDIGYMLINPRIRFT
ncbi:MAG: ABC transporter permease [Proteobacteria bacterium]|nr:ABC transporter permease [Pseudomonadota bacterium]MDA1070150.1 ABC transporter permease [Pseudomonadota bacterium]